MSVVAVVGAGTMGRGIAQVCAAAGLRTLLFDARPGAAKEAFDSIAAALATLVSKGRLAEAEAGRSLARLEVVGSIDGLANADLAIECISEDLGLKRELFRRLEATLARDSILATNTSSLSVTAIAAACANPERIAGLHFFNPATHMQLVEVIGGMATSASTQEALCGLARRLGKRPVCVSDTPGFLVNHAGRALIPEALRIISEGIATPEQVDVLLREVAGFRMGPFQLLDLVGADIAYAVMTAIHDQYFGEPMYQPSYLLAARAAGGVLGRKSGRGFYDYAASTLAPGGKGVGVNSGAPCRPPPGAALPEEPVWVAERDAELPRRWVDHLRANDIRVSDDPVPPPGAPCFVAPLGEDCSSAIVRLGLDPRRTLAVDMLVPSPRRITLMRSPLADPEISRQAEALLQAKGLAATTIKDSPGFVVQRLLAMIVNVGTRIAELGIAVPADIDVAVEMGLNYPMGPLALGDSLGAQRVLAVLDGMFALTHDPKYRASLWLRRRAALGCALSTPS